MEEMEHFFLGVWYLFKTPLEFPAPIGSLSPLDILMFFAVAYLLADTVSLIASRRD